MAKGFRAGTQNGVKFHYHFYADYHLGLQQVAARRIPCACPSCHQQITKPWDDSIKDPSNQPKFQEPENCVFKDVFGDLNDWKIITLQQVKGNCVEGEVLEMFEDTLGAMESAAATSLEEDCYFAYNAPTEPDSPDGYYIVRATGQAFSLPEDSREVQGCNYLEAGSIVVTGVFLNIVPRATRWYTPPPDRTKEYLFRVRYVLDPGVVMEAPSVTVVLPNSTNKADIMNLHPRRVSKHSCATIDTEIGRRAMLDYWQYEGLDAADAALAFEDEMNDDSDPEEDSEDDESSEDE